MAKVIRSTYPAAFSMGLLCLIYVIAFFLSEQIFDTSLSNLKGNTNIYFGMFLVATAVMIMILILWEEFLFPIKLREVNGGMIFHNHRNKLQTQLLIFCFIPIIFVFIYFNYEINIWRFLIVASICIALPLLEKIASGVKNYNDFLRVTNEEIEYKDNEKEGLYEVKNIQMITIITHESDITHQIELLFRNNDTVTIDLHEMELEEYYNAIYKYFKAHYGHMLKEVKVD